MGTKKPSCTLFDNINTSDRKLQPGGRISREPSPRAAMTAQSERDRDGNRGEVWRRERETENVRDKARYKDVDPRERYYERDRAPAPRPRDGEREWRERERRQEDDRSRNGRLLPNAERVSEREEVVRGMKKGDTFPRMSKSSADYGRSTMTTAEIDVEREERRQTDRPKRLETDGRERERTRQREREPGEIRSRAKEEGRHTGRRPVEDEKSRQRVRYQESDVGFHDKRRELGDSRERRVRDADRRRENPRPDTGKGEGRVPSPQRRRDGDLHSDRKERERAQRREGWRDTRSEGDSEEREMRRGRDRNRQREEMQYRHSRSEGENTGKTKREKDRDRQWYREEDRQRYRDRDREREVDRSRRRGVEEDGERYREFDKRAPRQAGEGDRCKGRERDTMDDRLEDGRSRDHKQRRCRDTKGREPEPRWQDATDRGSRSLNERAPRVPRAQSSGEWSTTESDKDVEEQMSAKSAVSKSEQKRFEKQERERVETTGGMSEQRRMWLEPQRGKNSKEEFEDRERRARERSTESQVGWGRDGQRVKEQPYDSYRGNVGWQTEGVNVDGEGVGQVRKEMDKGGKEHLSDSDGGMVGNWQRDAEGENVTDNTEESDREEEGGSDFRARSESEGGSETGWKQDRDRMLSGEDGFVTVSSGGDEGDEREEDEEEEFEDCQESWETAYDGRSAAAFKECEGDKEREGEWTRGKEEGVDEDEQGREKQPKYIFCVIGHTLPQATSGEKSLPQVDQVKEVERDNPDLKSRHQCSQDGTRKPQDDRHATLSRDDESPILNNQDKENKVTCDPPREDRAAAGETRDLVSTRYRVFPELEHTETEERMRQEKENPYAEIGPINRDPLTDRLLIEWREKNKEVERERGRPLPDLSKSFDGVCSQVNVQQIQPILDVINSGAMSPEEVEAIRIRLSGAWSLSEEPKRHSQAPHLKWAKNVVREILGLSEDQTLDELNAELLGTSKGQGVKQPEMTIRYDKRLTEVEETGETADFKLRMDGQHSEPEPEEEPLESEDLRGMGHSQADMHAEQFTAMHGDTPTTYTQADTLIDTEGKEGHSLDKETESSGHLPLEKADVRIGAESGDEAKLSEIQNEVRREKEVEMYLSVSNTLYKPNSCPILHCETSESDLHIPSREGEDQEVEDRTGERERERQGEEAEQMGVAEELGKMREGEVTDTDGRQGVAEEPKKERVLKMSCSFRDLGPEARLRRRGIRKTTERRNGELVEVEEEKEEGGVGRDRRTRVFSTTGNKRLMEILVSVLKSAPRNPHHFLSFGSQF